MCIKKLIVCTTSTSETKHDGYAIKESYFMFEIHVGVRGSGKECLCLSLSLFFALHPRKKKNVDLVFGLGIVDDNKKTTTLEQKKKRSDHFFYLLIRVS